MIPYHLQTQTFPGSPGQTQNNVSRIVRPSSTTYQFDTEEEEFIEIIYDLFQRDGNVNKSQAKTQEAKKQIKYVLITLSETFHRNNHVS